MNSDVLISDIIRLVHAAETGSASKVKSVTSTILVNRDLHKCQLAAIFGFGLVNRQESLANANVKRAAAVHV